VLQEAGVSFIVPLDDRVAIQKKMDDFLNQLQQGNIKPETKAQVGQYSRQFRTRQLAKLLNEVIEEQ